MTVVYTDAACELVSKRAQHHYDVAAMFPQHPPEILGRLSERTLSRDVWTSNSVSLHVHVADTDSQLSPSDDNLSYFTSAPRGARVNRPFPPRRPSACPPRPRKLSDSVRPDASLIVMFHFLPRDAMQARPEYSVMWCPSVRHVREFCQNE